MILPWGNRAPENSETGMAGSAPANPRIKEKFLITGGISLMIWGVVFALVHFEVIDFYAVARDMVKEDFE
ncbi:MAG: DUF1467 family protein [Alphaproteobacteria bacterium]|nr:DUF1467 family protein [Alphaproteobacteria bacterium]